jgi:hypothetical protein
MSIKVSCPRCRFTAFGVVVDGPDPGLASRGSIVVAGTNSCPIVQAQVQEMQMIREKVYQMEQAQIGLKAK